MRWEDGRCFKPLLWFRDVGLLMVGSRWGTGQLWGEMATGHLLEKLEFWVRVTGNCSQWPDPTATQGNTSSSLQVGPANTSKKLKASSEAYVARTKLGALPARIKTKIGNLLTQGQGHISKLKQEVEYLTSKGSLLLPLSGSFLFFLHSS